MCKSYSFTTPKFWTTHFYRCENVRVHDCEIVAEVIDGVRGPSTDAIDIDVCRGFTVSNVVMDVNDDAVVVKGGKGLEANNYAKFPGNGPSEGIVVEDCLFKSLCHSCLTLGSECPAVSNVVMRGCRLEGPGNFVNVKMRDDTPQDYSGILVESCRGNCRKLFNCRAWKQFSTVKNEEESPVSRLADFTMRGNKVVARKRPDSFKDRAFIKFSNCRIEDGVMPFSWPEPTQTMKPWVYNWWMGSAVDKAGLELQCRELADKGFGGFHVIPIYGAKGGYEKNWKPLLSPQWIEAWNLAAGLASYNGLGVDLTMGSGWNFGGPWIPEDLAASSKVKVMRAGPGGEGYMVDPFNPESMKAHVAAFAALFGKGGSAERPRAFYHDSYEYYGAKPREGQDVEASQIATFKVWADWCRENGYATRNQAHGSPANWLDLYALADIPETEMFRQHRNILVAKFASSAAHVKGTTLVAAETCTWVDEHFCERPREIKEFIDRLFLSGVNHVFYHGMCYSPTDAEWPGWCFYASLEMNPRNPIWREVGALNAYVTRCQSLFQTWTCDNDLLVLWDTEALRKKDAKWQPNSGKWFKKSTTGRLAKKLFDNGYAFDYVSPRLLRSVDRGGRYVETVDAEKGERPRKAKPMPFNAANGLMATRWKTRDGRQAYFVVNQGGKAREVQSRIPFVVMDPLSGEVAETTKWTLEQGHSAFFVGETFNVAEPSATSWEFRVVAGPWTVTPVCGGPAMPASRTIDALAGWETWDEAFCGTMRYETSFDCEAGDCAAIDLGDVREIARVRLNGRDLGVRFMPPYRFDIPSGLAKDKGNRLEVEVTNLGANRIRDLDRRKVNWKYFCDRNVYGTNYKPLDAFVWPVRESGILGPVHLVGIEHGGVRGAHGEIQ